MILQNVGNDRTSDIAAAAAEHLHPQQTAVETSNFTQFIKFTVLAKLCLFLSADSVVAVTWTSKNVQQMYHFYVCGNTCPCYNTRSSIP